MNREPPPDPDGLPLVTASGRLFPLDPLDLTQVDIYDVAHALSYLNRYTGHTRTPFCVANHSIVCFHLAEDAGYPPQLQLDCLLHDAAEAYLNDLSAPLRHLLRSKGELTLFSVEDQILHAIYEAYGLKWAALGPHHQPEVREIDHLALAGEVLELYDECAHAIWRRHPYVSPVDPDRLTAARAIVRRAHAGVYRRQVRFLDAFFALRKEINSSE